MVKDMTPLRAQIVAARAYEAAWGELSKIGALGVTIAAQHRIHRRAAEIMEAEAAKEEGAAMDKDSADVRAAAQALLDRLYASHLPSNAALPHASVEWKDARAKADALRDLLVTPSPAPAVAEGDARLIDALRDESWDLRCFDVPTGGGDADIGWRVVSHYMAPPKERVVAEVYHDDPRAAIRAAIRANGGEG